MTDLRVSVASLRDTPRTLELRADSDWWTEHSRGDAEGELGGRLLAPFELHLDAHAVGRRLLFRGKVTGLLELVCGRCTEPFRYALEEPVTLLLEPLPSHAEAPEGGIALDPDDLELGRYAGEELDFGPVLLETLLTSWPMQPRCSEACRGLCPSCGANLNLAPCGCDVQEGNRPFEGLGELLAKGSSGQGTAKKSRD